MLSQRRILETATHATVPFASTQAPGAALDSLWLASNGFSEGSLLKTPPALKALKAACKAKKARLMI